MATLKNRWHGQIWVIRVSFPSIIWDSCCCLNSGCSPTSEGFTQIWELCETISLKIGSHLNDLILSLKFEWRTQNWGKAKIKNHLSTKHSRHKKSFWWSYVMFAKSLIIHIRIYHFCCLIIHVWVTQIWGWPSTCWQVMRYGKILYSVLLNHPCFRWVKSFVII